MGLFNFSFSSGGNPGGNSGGSPGAAGAGQPGVPASQTSPYPAGGKPAAPGQGPSITPSASGVTAGNGDPFGPGSLAAGLGAINDYASELNSIKNMALMKDRDAFAHSKYSSHPAYGVYDGGANQGVQYNDKDNTEFIDLPTPSPSGFSEMTTFKFTGPPYKRVWTTDNVHFYNASTNPPRLGKPPPRALF